MATSGVIDAEQRERLSLPQGGTWYWRQQSMLEQWVATEHKSFTVAYDRKKKDGTVTKVYGLYPDPQDFYCNLAQVDRRFAYELQPEDCECRAHADIEWMGESDEGERKISMVVRALREKLRVVLSGPAEIYVLCGSRATEEGVFKHSYHIIVANLVLPCNHDTRMLLLFSSLHNEGDDEWYYTDKAGKRKLIIDLGIYTKNRCFRLPFCCKCGSDVPLIRISCDPFLDDLTSQEFCQLSSTDMSSVMPMLISQATSTIIDEKTIRCLDKQISGPAQRESRPTKRARLNDQQPQLQFPLKLLSQMLRDAGDQVSQPSKVTQDQHDGRFVVQCDQKQQTRNCLTTDNKTHHSNNCLLFVKQFEDPSRYKIEYYCTDPDCSHGRSCPILGYVAFNSETGTWERQTTFTPVGFILPGTSSQGNLGESLQVGEAPAQEDSDEDNSSLEPPAALAQPYDPKNPSMNTYALVKKRHEETCFKILSPLAYLVMIDGKDEPDSLTPSKLCDLFANKFYYELDKEGHWKKHLFINRWIRDEDIKQYSRTVVEPPTAPHAKSGVYNLWRPFAAASLDPVDEQEIPELIQPIVQHLADVIANGDPAIVEWLLDLQANMFQRPHKKSRVAVSLYGEEGCGKGIVFEFIRREILGEFLSFQTSLPESDLFGRFANGALHRLCVQVDEVKSLHEHADRLKDFITNDTLNYEQKGKDTITVGNYANLILTSNNPNALTVSTNDRRFALFRCSSVHRGNKSYFDTLGDHLKRKDVARAFYQHLLSRDLSKYPYDFQSSRPITEYYRETQLASIPVLARFLSAWVNDDGPFELSARDMYTRYRVFKESGNYQGIKTETSFFRELKRISGVEKTKRGGVMMYRLDKQAVKAELEKSNKFDPDATLN